MELVCLDVEGVLVPEIWINVAERTGIEGLRLTTRDVPDYDELMMGRLALLDEHGLTLPDIQAVIGQLDPLPGARAFLDALRARYPVILLSDTFEEFAGPLMAALGYPTLFCHRLETDGKGRIATYRLRMANHKQAAVEALRGLNFRVAAAGDSYNDTTMLGAANAGILFRAPERVIAEFPQFPHVRAYDDLRRAIDDAFVR